MSAKAHLQRPRREAHVLYGGLWLAVSFGLHAMLMLLFVIFGITGRGLIAGAGSPDGTGFGGTSIAIEIEGWEDGLPRGAVPLAAPSELSGSRAQPAEDESTRENADNPDAENALVMPEEPETPVTPDEAETSIEEPPPPEPRPRRPPTPEVEGPEIQPTPTPASETVDGVATSAPGEAEDAAGTGAEDSTGGNVAGDPGALIRGSAGIGGDAITASRALLPNGDRCDDPVVGTWQARKFRPNGRSWVRFILRVRRGTGDELTGTITSRIWTGRASRPNPGNCTAFGFDHTWRMDARGRIDGNRMTFGSRRARLIRQDCPTRDTRYAPDRFSGTIDPMRNTFQSLNNDGAFDIDEPYSFRRVSCDP